VFSRTNKGEVKAERPFESLIFRSVPVLRGKGTPQGEKKKGENEVFARGEEPEGHVTFSYNKAQKEKKKIRRRERIARAGCFGARAGGGKKKAVPDIHFDAGKRGGKAFSQEGSTQKKEEGGHALQASGSKEKKEPIRIVSGRKRNLFLHREEGIGVSSCLNWKKEMPTWEGGEKRHRALNFPTERGKQDGQFRKSQSVVHFTYFAFQRREGKLSSGCWGMGKGDGGHCSKQGGTSPCSRLVGKKRHRRILEVFRYAGGREEVVPSQGLVWGRKGGVDLFL